MSRHENTGQNCNSRVHEEPSESVATLKMGTSEHLQRLKSYS